MRRDDQQVGALPPLCRPSPATASPAASTANPNSVSPTLSSSGACSPSCSPRRRRASADCSSCAALGAGAHQPGVTAAEGDQPLVQPGSSASRRPNRVRGRGGERGPRSRRRRPQRCSLSPRKPCSSPGSRRSARRRCTSAPPGACPKCLSSLKAPVAVAGSRRGCRRTSAAAARRQTSRGRRYDGRRAWSSCSWKFLSLSEDQDGLPRLVLRDPLSSPASFA